MFALVKLVEALFRPFNLVFLLAGFGALLLFTRRWRLGRGVIVAALTAALLPAVLPLGQWLTGALEGRFPAPAALPAHVDGIVVLGGAVDPRMSARQGMPAIRGAADRITAMVILSRRYPEARIVYSGGSGDPLDQEHREAPEVRRLLSDMGCGIAAMRFEDRSRNTHENAVFSRELMAPTPGETWLLVTSAMHMPRAVGSFRAVGWPVIAYPVDYATLGGLDWRPRFDVGGGLGQLEGAAHELLGLVLYRLSGWTDALLPGP